MIKCGIIDELWYKTIEVNKKLTHLDLSHNFIEEIGVNSLAKSLEKNTTLQFLTIDGLWKNHPINSYLHRNQQIAEFLQENSEIQNQTHLATLASIMAISSKNGKIANYDELDLNLKHLLQENPNQEQLKSLFKDLGKKLQLSATTNNSFGDLITYRINNSHHFKPQQTTQASSSRQLFSELQCCIS